jgi:hypothetical protein
MGEAIKEITGVRGLVLGLPNYIFKQYKIIS